MNTQKIIDKIGGVRATARRFRIGEAAVRYWIRDNAIPSKHWPVLNSEYNIPWKHLATLTKDRAA